MLKNVYRQRKPQESPYYQCVEDYFETFEQVFDDRFPRQYGFLRPYVKQVIHRYLDCGLLQNGFTRVRCGDCGHEYLLAFSCKRRHFCPSCHQKRVVEFGEWLCRDEKAVPGAVVAIQTFGDLLGYHPHLHILISDGCFHASDMFSVSPAVDTRTIEFEALEWLAAMCSHVPNKGEQMARYYGYYSNVSRGKRKKAGIDDKISGILAPELSNRAIRRSWARLIQKIYEVDPLVCPKCSGNMKVIAFIEKPGVIKKFLNTWVYGTPSTSPIRWPMARLPINCPYMMMLPGRVRMIC